MHLRHSRGVFLGHKHQAERAAVVRLGLGWGADPAVVAIRPQIERNALQCVVMVSIHRTGKLEILTVRTKIN